MLMSDQFKFLLVNVTDLDFGDSLYEIHMVDLPIDMFNAILDKVQTSKCNMFFKGDKDGIADRLMYEVDDDNDDVIKKVVIPKTLVSSACYEGGKQEGVTFATRGSALVIVIGEIR